MYHRQSRKQSTRTCARNAQVNKHAKLRRSKKRQMTRRSKKRVGGMQLKWGDSMDYTEMEDTFELTYDLTNGIYVITFTKKKPPQSQTMTPTLTESDASDSFKKTVAVTEDDLNNGVTNLKRYRAISTPKLTSPSDMMRKMGRKMERIWYQQRYVEFYGRLRESNKTELSNKIRFKINFSSEEQCNSFIEHIQKKATKIDKQFYETPSFSGGYDIKKRIIERAFIFLKQDLKDKYKAAYTTNDLMTTKKSYLDWITETIEKLNQTHQSFILRKVLCKHVDISYDEKYNIKMLWTVFEVMYGVDLSDNNASLKVNKLVTLPTFQEVTDTEGEKKFVEYNLEDNERTLLQHMFKHLIKQIWDENITSKWSLNALWQMENMKVSIQQMCEAFAKYKDGKLTEDDFNAKYENITSRIKKLQDSTKLAERFEQLSGKSSPAV